MTHRMPALQEWEYKIVGTVLPAERDRLQSCLESWQFWLVDDPGCDTGEQLFMLVDPDDDDVVWYTALFRWPHRGVGNNFSLHFRVGKMTDTWPPQNKKAMWNDLHISFADWSIQAPVTCAGRHYSRP